MRILAFNYEYPPLGGGGGVVFQALYDELAKRHEVTIVTSAHGDLPRLESRGGQQIYRVPVLARRRVSTATLVSMLTYVPSSWQRGKSLLSEGRYDVINTHFAVPTGPAPQDLAHRFRIPNVLSVHGGDIFDPSKRLSPHRLPVVRTLVRNLLLQADRVIANSRNTRENARTLYDVDREIDVIPLGLDLPAVPARDRAALGVAEDRFVMVTVGRLVARKGVDGLLEAIRRLDDPRDLLVVLGRGPLLPELQDKARALGVAERVKFTGPVSEPDKWRWLAAADVYASTALHEGFGLVFLEGLHAGLPVICYDCGGQTDFLEDGVTGAVVTLGDLERFVAAVNQLKADPARRADIARRNRARAADFTSERFAERCEAIFAQEVARAAGHRA